MNGYKIILITALLGITSCNKIAKETTKEVMEETSEKAVSKVMKGTLKDSGTEILEKGIRNQLRDIIPSGKASLKVVEISPNKWIPEFNNLGDKALKYSKEINDKVLIERRKSISPYMQFPTIDNLKNIKPESVIIGEHADAAILEKNMLMSMGIEIRRVVNAFGGKAAHHVVEGTDPLAKQSRTILEKFNIDINSPANGIFLPTDKNSIFKGTLHKTGHTKEYSEYVYNQIKHSKNEHELIDALNQIKYDLYNGKISLEGRLHAINKNDINI